MRNLKRALSLVMAMALIVGMMVVSASAAGSNDFTDADEIEHIEAVEVMTALNVIDGKEDGSYYDPTGTLTRAEMAKIVAYVMNGGVEPNIGTKVIPTYSDIDNHWAEAYIEYCTSMGIIAGDGAGKFNPGGTLTASQTAKMFLTAMGYDANVFGLLGNDWETNTNRYANEAGLYDELGNVSVSAPISRDDAAQMAYNAIQATMMRRTWSQDMQTGEIGETYAPWMENDGSNPMTLLRNKFNAVIEYAYMDGAEYDEDRDEYNYTFDVATGAFGGSDIDNDEDLSEPALSFGEDVSDLYGHQVKVIYKNDTAKTVYGIYANESTVLTSGVIGDIPTDLTAADSSAKINDVTYRLRAYSVGNTALNSAADVDVYEFLDGAVSGNLANLGILNVEWAFDLIDNDGDGRANCAVVYPTEIAKVTYVGSSSITMDNSVGSMDLEDDINVYEGIARNDYVALTDADHTVDGKAAVVKLDVITGTVDAVRDNTTRGTEEVQIDGTWYDYVNTYGGSTLSDGNLGDNVTLQVVNGYYVDSEVTLADGSNNLVYISATKDGTTGVDTSFGDATVTARGYFTDGAYETITIDKVNGEEVTGVKQFYNGTMPQLTAYNDTTETEVVVGMMYRYAVDSDGNYELTALDGTTANSADRAGYDAYAGSNRSGVAFTDSTSRVNVGGNSYAVSDDTVVFAQTTNTANNETRVVTGKALKNWDWDAFGNTLTVQVLADTVNGVNTARVITLVNSDASATISGSDTTSYGYVVAKPERIRVDGSTVYQYKIWNGTEDITVYAETAEIANNTPGAVVKGSFVSYEMEGEDEVINLNPITSQYAVTGISGADENVLDLLASDGTTRYDAVTVDADDTTVIYVDTADGVGVEGGSFTLANEIYDGVYELNVVAAAAPIKDGATLSVIFVDVDNKLAGTDAVITAASLDAAAVNGLLDIQDEVVIPGLSAAGTINVPAGKSLEFEAMLPEGTVLNVAAGAVIIAETGFQVNGASATADVTTSGGTLVLTANSSGGWTVTADRLGTTFNLKAATSLGDETPNFYSGSTAAGATAVSSPVPAGTYIWTEDVSSSNVTAWYCKTV